MRYEKIQKACNVNMHDIARRVAGNSERVKCPFHEDPGTSMKIYDNHASCPECGMFNPVQYVMKAKSCTEREAIDFCLTDSVPGYIATARQLMRAMKQNAAVKVNVPDEYSGYVIKGIFPVSSELKGTPLESDPLAEGIVFFLDEGFIDSEGTLIGRPGFTKVKGQGDYITICSTYRKAIMMSDDSACEASAEKLASFGRPVLAMNEDQAEYLAEHNVRAGYKKNGKVFWAGESKIKEGLQYHDRGDLFNYMRCLPGIDRWKLDAMDEWMYMTGEDADIMTKDFLSEEGKRVINAMRIPQELHFNNTAMTARADIKTHVRAPEIAHEKKNELLKLRVPRIPEKEISRRHITPLRGYFRFPKKRMRISGDKAVFMLDGNITAEVPAGVLHNGRGFVYASTTSDIRFYQMFEEGSVELNVMPKSIKRVHLMRQRTLHIPVPEAIPEGDRYRIPIKEGYLSVRKEYIQKNGDVYMLTLLHGYEPPVHDESGAIKKDEEGKAIRVSGRTIRKAFLEKNLGKD